MRIRLVAPDAGEVEELVARDGVYRLPPVGREPQEPAARSAKCGRSTARCKARKAGSRASAASIPTSRADVPLAAWDDARGLIKVNPVADWSDAGRSTAYIAANNVPVNPLHAPRLRLDRLRALHPRGRSPARTRAPAAGGGRTRTKKECGLHVARTAQAAEEEKAA